MLKKQQEARRGVLEILCMEDMVPTDHLLRKVDAAIDFNHLYDFVGELYCKDNGRPSVDPMVLFKIVLIQHLFGIPSLRRTMAEIQVNIAYRWFLGYALSDELPHFSTVSYNFRHRYSDQTVEQMFEWILTEASRAGCLSPEAVYIDSTHIKANANVNRKIKKQVPVAAARYKEELFLEINRDREEHGKPPFKDDGNQPPEEKEITVSTTDPDSGMFCKDEHKRCFAYKAHTACDDHGFVLDVVVTEGNVNDSVAFHPLYDRLTERYAQMQVVIADAAYKTPYICKRIFEDNRVISTAYKCPQTMKGGHEWYKYVYDEYYDSVICPQYHTLHYTTTNRDGYREYKSRSYVCTDCPTRNKCTHSKSCEKTVLLHVWRNYVELAEEVRYIPKYKALYEKRKEKIERVFADAKEKYGMRYTLYRGLCAVSKWVRLKFAAMNLKKLAKWLWEKGPSPNSFLFLVHYYTTKTQSLFLGLGFSTG